MTAASSTIADLKRRAAAVADRYIPAVDRDVTGTDNLPPAPIEALSAQSDRAMIEAVAASVMEQNPAIEAATAQAALVKAFIAENPVIQTAEEAQKAAAWIESTRRTLAAMEDERKPKVDPFNAALNSINGAYRVVREPLESMVKIIAGRWNTWDRAERARREAEALRVQREAEEAARRAQDAIEAANQAIADAEVGECTDVGTAVVEAEAAAREAQIVNRAAVRAVKATNVRVASTLGGKAISSRRKRVVVIDDPCAAIKAIGLTEKIELAIRQCAEAFEEAHGMLPAGTRETFERSI